MGRVIDIDWEGVINISDKLKAQSEELEKLTKDLESDFNSASSCWRGLDSKNYQKNSKEIVSNLTNEYIFLYAWYKKLSKSAKIYNGNIEDGLQGIRDMEKIIDEEIPKDVLL